MAEAPSTWMAVLFTDIVGSTRLWAVHYDAMSEDLARHDAVLHGAIEQHDGRIFATASWMTARDAHGNLYQAIGAALGHGVNEGATRAA